MIDDFTMEYRFLSNFYPCDIEYEGLVFPSVEAAYQASKTLSIIERKSFMYVRPGKAKRMGNKLRIRSDWEYVKLSIMTELVGKKFADPVLLRKLLHTYPHYLKEGNSWHDNYWGSCNCEKCGDKGINMLGKILMSIRNI